MIGFALGRYAPAIIGVLAIVGIVTGLYLDVKRSAYLDGKRSAENERALQDARDHIETRERIDEAISNPDNCAWLDRLRGHCAD